MANQEELMSIVKSMRQMSDVIRSQALRADEMDAQIQANHAAMIAVIATHPEPQKLFEVFADCIDAAGSGSANASPELVAMFRKPLQDYQEQILRAIKKSG